MLRFVLMDKGKAEEELVFVPSKTPFSVIKFHLFLLTNLFFLLLSQRLMMMIPNASLKWREANFSAHAPIQQMRITTPNETFWRRLTNAIASHRLFSCLKSDSKGKSLHHAIFLFWVRKKNHHHHHCCCRRWCCHAVKPIANRIKFQIEPFYLNVA